MAKRALLANDDAITVKIGEENIKVSRMRAIAKHLMQQP